ncbi:MAG TPA: DUF2807 domain-containing protein [Bacteroidales bacterium]
MGQEAGNNLINRIVRHISSISASQVVLYCLLTLFSVYQTSCNKALFDAGDTTTREVNIDSAFSTINIENIFDITLVNDTLNKVLITTGENLQSYVSIEAKNGVLYLNHSVKENWSRKYQKIKLEVHLTSGPHIDIHEPISLKTKGVFKCDNFVIVDWWKVSEVDVNLDANFCGIYMSSDNFGYFKVKGKTQTADIWGWGSAYVHADSLVAQNCHVLQRGMADVYVNVTGQLSVDLEFTGDVYYTGNPTEVIIEKQTSSGRLIKLH